MGSGVGATTHYFGRFNSRLLVPVTEDGDYLIFLAQPLAKGLEYPVYSGQSKMEKSVFPHLNSISMVKGEKEY